MDLLKSMNEALSYIEENLAGDIDYKAVGRIAQCSEHHFMKMFSFLSGVTLSEYIRRRRLSLAAFELMNQDARVIEIAMKYGYNSPDAFTRAFQRIHGVAPSRARKNGHLLKAYPPMTFQLTIQGGSEMKYRMEEKSDFHVVGFHKRMKVMEEDVDPKVAQLWENISDETLNELEELSDGEPKGMLHILTDYEETASESDEGEIDYYFAVATQKEPEHFVKLAIPASTWAVFEVDGDWMEIQEIWQRVYTEWFPSSTYEHAGGPEILGSSENVSEIWVPVVKK
jgi:AraC family transcriptional regulator